MFKDFIRLILLIALIVIAALQGCARYDQEPKPDFKADTILNNDYYAAAAGQPLKLAVLSNDKVSGNNTLVFGRPANGTIQFDTSNTGFVYVPAAGFRGKDTFQYKLCDNDFCLNATVEVQVSN